MEFRAEFAGVREIVWSTNALTFDTQDEASDYALSLLRRWTGADMARVVPIDTPKRQTVDPTDDSIVANYRSE